MSAGCSLIHNLFNKQKRYYFPFDKNEICHNGIYILFEKGETAHDTDRIVRVGTHTGEGQLPSRLEQHFLNENKDRSIFRKNIGRALLNMTNDPFLKYWEKDLTTNNAQKQFSGKIDFDKQYKIEKKVSEIIRTNFSFIIIPAYTKEERLYLETRIISSVSLCKECGPSSDWLGLHSPKSKIKQFGLWLVNGLNKEPLDPENIEVLKKNLIGKF